MNPIALGVLFALAGVSMLMLVGFVDLILGTLAHTTLLCVVSLRR
jgi:hypothetical protein